MNLDKLTELMVNGIKLLLSPAHIAFRDMKIDGPAFFVIPASLIILILSLWSIVWVYRDATNRDKNGFLAVLFILIAGWPLSFIWWFWLRPKSK